MIKLETKLNDDNFEIKKYETKESNGIEHIGTILFLIQKTIENTGVKKKELFKMLKESMKDIRMEEINNG